MKKIGIVSYNIYCNFTNYGSALQTWATYQTLSAIAVDIQPVLVDYCPDVLADKNPLNPFPNMWDKDEEARRMCELSLPAIRENYEKFSRFYRERFVRTSQKYTSENFHEIVRHENIEGFVCGSDTIFCIDEFGLDSGYFANYECMRNRSIAYAASFGDSHFSEEDYGTLSLLLKNFKALGIRENQMIPYVKSNVTVPVQRVLDPTLLLSPQDYDKLATERLEGGGYLLLYARRYNAEMEAYAEQLAKERGWKIIEISLRATNAQKPNRKMFYEAGVEEFLSLVKYAEFVVTNSFHGIIFSIQYKREFYAFSREQCDGKIFELLESVGLSDRLQTTGKEELKPNINYQEVYERLSKMRVQSKDFFMQSLQSLIESNNLASE